MELDKARVIADIGRVIVESGKAEVDFLKVTGKTEGTGFIDNDNNAAKLPAPTAGAKQNGHPRLAPAAGYTVPAEAAP